MAAIGLTDSQIIERM